MRMTLKLRKYSLERCGEIRQRKAEMPKLMAGDFAEPHSIQLQWEKFVQPFRPVGRSRQISCIELRGVKG